jgi:hypothetical protein
VDALAAEPARYLDVVVDQQDSHFGSACQGSLRNLKVS